MKCAKKALLDGTREASLTKEDLADIINVGIEELLRLRFELPAFSTIHRTAQYAKTQVNKQIYGQVTAELGNRRPRADKCSFKSKILAKPDRTGKLLKMSPESQP